MGQRKKKTAVLDDLDQAIIRELQKNSRSSFLEISKKVGASEGTVRNRVGAASKKQYIHLKTVLDPEKLGFDLNCIMGFEVSRKKLDEIAALIAGFPNVYYLSSCTGIFDLIAIMFFRNTRDFDDFMREKIGRIPDIIRTQTFVNMKVIKKPWVEDSNFLSGIDYKST